MESRRARVHDAIESRFVNLSSLAKAELPTTVRALFRPRRWTYLALALATLSPIALGPHATASATGAPSTLCSGYAGCSQGTFTTHGYQSHSGTSYWTMYAGNNCTNYVAYVESTTYGVATPSYSLGNGGQWAAAALAHGVLVNKTPTVGSVAVWTGGAAGMTSSGHVAVVEAVGPHNSYVIISQQHMIDQDGYDWVRLAPVASGSQWLAWPSEFVHFTTTSATPVVRPTPTTTTAAATVFVQTTALRRTHARFTFHLHKIRA